MALHTARVEDWRDVARKGYGSRRRDRSVNTGITKDSDGGHQTRQRMRLVDGLAYRFTGVRDLIQRTGDIRSAWPEIGTLLMREFQADGAMLCNDETIAWAGSCLEPLACASVDGWFVRQGELVWWCDSLSRHLPGFPLSQIAGVLALRLDPGGRNDMRIYLTRTEHIHEVAWGGNPDKPAEFHDGTLGIAPRRSFEKWMEKRLGYSRPWEGEVRLLAMRLRLLLAQEVTAPGV